MKLHKTIEPNKKNFRSLNFEKKYSEKFADYKFSGPNYYINFELLISANFDNNVKIFYDDLQDSEVAIPFISEGIEKFFSFLNSKNILLTNGLNFTVTNTKNHPVDFKPKMFVAFTFKRLQKIFFEHSRKYIQKPILDYTNSINENVAIIEKMPLKCYNYSNYEIRDIIDLPIIHQNDLVFPNNKLTKIFSDIENKFKIELLFSPHFQNEREGLKRINYFSILTSFSKESIETYISTKEIFELLTKEVYEEKYNLLGADIYIDILEYDSSSSYYAKSDYKYDLYYFIKELLLRNNNKIEL